MSTNFLNESSWSNFIVKSVKFPRLHGHGFDVYLRDVAGSLSKEMQFYLNWVTWINPEVIKEEHKVDYEEIIRKLQDIPKADWVKVGRELFQKAMAKEKI